jgi:hypothetical protein
MRVRRARRERSNGFAMPTRRTTSASEDYGLPFTMALQRISLEEQRSAGRRVGRSEPRPDATHPVSSPARRGQSQVPALLGDDYAGTASQWSWTIAADGGIGFTVEFGETLDRAGARRHADAVLTIASEL